MKIKLSQSDWKDIGLRMGWLKTNDAKLAQSNGGDAHDPDRMNMAETPGDLDPSFEEEDSEEGMGEDFSYLTSGHEDDARMVRLRQAAESLAGQFDDSSDVHVAVYWLLSKFHGGQNSPEYAALSSSPYSPGPMERGPEGEGKWIYKELLGAYKGQ